MQELLLKRNHLFFLHFFTSQKMHTINFCGSQAQVSTKKKRDSLQNFHRTLGLLLENYLPDRTNHYRKCPTAIGEHLAGIIFGGDSERFAHFSAKKSH